MSNNMLVFSESENQPWQQAELDCDKRHAQNINIDQASKAVTKSDKTEKKDIHSHKSNEQPPVYTNPRDYYLFANDIQHCFDLLISKKAIAKMANP